LEGSRTFRRSVPQGLKPASIGALYAALKRRSSTSLHAVQCKLYYDFDGRCFILDSSRLAIRGCTHYCSLAAKDYPMTYLDVVFRYGAAPGENELRAIDGMREVYGVRRVQFNERERTVRVEFDASRLKTEAVSRLLRQAGVDVREPLALT
jgi:hypothetical protein